MRRLRFLAILLVVSTALTACKGSSAQPGADGAAAGQGQGGGAQAGGGQGRRAGGPGGGRGGGVAIPVKAGPVKVEQVIYRIKAVGTLEAEELIQVPAELDGIVSEVKFREGDRVTTNTVLALIDPERYKLEYDRAEAAYRHAVADAANATATLARREALAKEQLVSIEDLNSTKTASERLDADVSSAKAARDLAAQNLSRSAVKPHHGGVIDKRMVDTGAFVRTGTNLATIVDLSRLLLRFKISETESLRAKKGQVANFKVAATGDRQFNGTIYHVGEVADPTSRQVEVLAWVPNPGMLKPGFFAEISLPSDSTKDAIVVPETAIQASDRGFVAFAIVDGKARVRPVELGPRTGGGNVEILSGLSAGETVVYEGSDRIADGVALDPNGRIPGDNPKGSRVPGSAGSASPAPSGGATTPSAAASPNGPAPGGPQGGGPKGHKRDQGGAEGTKPGGRQ